MISTNMSNNLYFDKPIKIEKAGLHGWIVYIGADSHSLETWNDVLIFLASLNNEKGRM